MKLKNIFAQIPEDLPEELSEQITHGSSFKLERIVSQAHTTPVGQWYDQDHNEWVMVLKGSADIVLEGQPGAISMKPGDYLELPAHCKHRVERTDQETIWLAMHYEPRTTSQVVQG